MAILTQSQQGPSQLIVMWMTTVPAFIPLCAPNSHWRPAG